MTVVLTHLLAAYMILAAPWLGRVVYQRARKRIEGGDPLAKEGLYRTIVTDQVVTTAFALGLSLFGGISARSLGLGAPRFWWLSAGLTVVLGSVLLWSGIRLRAKAQKIREKLKDRAEALLPDTLAECRWFAAVSIGAGISEELLFRGFLFYYLSWCFPHIQGWESAVLTSLAFGMIHLYQGWKGILSTSIVGLITAGLYLLTGNLLVPMVFHASADLRALLIFWPSAPPAASAAEAT